MISDVLSDAVVKMQEYLDHEGTRDCYQGETRERITGLMEQMTQIRVLLDAPPGYEPAEPGDTRFVVGDRDEDGYCRVAMVDDKGQVEWHVIRYDEVGSFIDSFRRSQGMSYAEAAEPFGELYQWEKENGYA